MMELGLERKIKITKKNIIFADLTRAFGIAPAAGDCWRRIDLLKPRCALERKFNKFL